MRHQALLTAILLTSAAACSVAQPISVDLQLAGANGVVVTEEGAGIGLSMLQLRDPALVSFEAETAEGLALQEGSGITESPDASGGAYIDRVTHAEYPITIPEQGAYQGWARIFLPHPGSWNHEESMNTGGKKRVNDSERWVFGEWIWSKLGSYTLGPGENRFILHNFLGGARIDCIFFTRNAALRGEGLVGLPTAADGMARVTTAPVRPSRVKSWGALRIDADLNGGAVEAEVSSDGGVNWLPAAKAGDLSALKVAGDGSDTLLARLTLKPGPDGESPVVRSVAASLTADPDGEVALENDHYRISFARDTGRLCGIFNKRTSTPATTLHIQQPVMALGVRQADGGALNVVTQDEIRFEGVEQKPRALELTYSALEGRVRIGVELTADDTPLATVRQSITNNSDMEIVRLDFPLIGNAALGAHEDDEAVLPRTGGIRVANPAADKAYMTTYMGGGSMAWMELCDKTSGLFMMVADQKLTSTEIECAAAPGRRGVNLAFRTLTAVLPGKSRQREYRLGIHEGDWHWGADRYREWAYSWMKHPDDPQWARWCDGWCHGSGDLAFGHMSNMMRRMEAEGWEYLQYWGQMTDGIDQCCGNFYWPAPALGGPEGFKQGISDVHALGGRVTGYMNCQTWTRDSYKNDSLRRTPKSDLPQAALDLIHPLEWFEQWRLRQIDGSALGYYASTLGWYIMCPASEGFREHLRWWIVEKYAKEYGADGVYIDQTGATAAKPCYNLEHGHDDIGDWGAGNVEMLRQAVTQARAVNPDFTISIEGSGDALGQYASLHLLSGLCTHPEVYHYTFPDHILISGMANSSQLSASQRVTKAHLNGDRFDTRVGDELTVQALQLRQRIKRWLYPGRFMDTVGLEISDPKVLGRWSLCDQPGNRAIVFTFENEPAVQGAMCSLELPEGWRQPASLFIFDHLGSVIAAMPEITDGRIAFEVPAELMSAALLVYETTPANAMDAWPCIETAPDGTAEVVVLACNFGTETRPVSVKLSADEPLQLSGGELTLEPAAGSIAGGRVGVEGVGELLKPGIIRTEASWDGGTRRARGQVRPFLLNPSLDIDDDGDGMPDYWTRSCATGPYQAGIEDGAFFMQGDEKALQCVIQRVAATPNTEYYFSARIKRSEQTDGIKISVVETLEGGGYRFHTVGDDAALPADEWHDFETTFTTGESFKSVIIYLYNASTPYTGWYDDIVLMPAAEMRSKQPLLNANLDADTDGNGVPDHWGLGGTTADFPRGIEDGAFWIQGQPEHYQYAMQIVPLKPNTTYRVGGRIMRSAPSDGVSIGFVQFVGEKGLRLYKIGDDAAAPAGQWQTFAGEFRTGGEFRRAAVYLYNIHTGVKAWYDNIFLQAVE